MAKQQVKKPAQGPMTGGIVRASGPKNVQKPDDEQPDPTPQQTSSEKRIADVRALARTGNITYGEIVERFKLKGLDELYGMLEPDLVQVVDPETQQLVEDEDDE